MHHNQGIVQSFTVFPLYFSIKHSALNLCSLIIHLYVQAVYNVLYLGPLLTTPQSLDPHKSEPCKPVYTIIHVTCK